MTDFNTMTDALVSYDTEKIIQLINDAIAADVPASEILNKGLIAGMDLVGERMEDGKMFIPEVLMTAQTMAACLDLIKPLLGEGEGNEETVAVIGTVKGDLHDIGKNLVAMMLEGAGMTVVDLGVDISPEDFVAKAQEHNAKLVCLSTLLTTTMPMMKQTVDAIIEAGIRDDVKILVGGAPVSQAFADQIGADGFAPDASSATKLARAMSTPVAA